MEPMKDTFTYSEQVELEISRAVRRAIPISRLSLERAKISEDYGGIDVVYIVNQRCPLAIRCRFDRPAYAADSDVTFRHTEPAMFDARTYAPLTLFLWFTRGYVAAGKLIDSYRMAERIDPPLTRRGWTQNRTGTRTYWTKVDISELHRAGALLRMGDADGWVAARLGGNEDTIRIVRTWDGGTHGHISEATGEPSPR